MREIDQGIYCYKTEYENGYEKGRREAEEICKHERMTLRDRFAMAALTGNLAFAHPDFCVVTDVKNQAEYAYELADAMLAARKGGE